MGLGSLCQRTLLCVGSRRQHVITKLLLFFLLCAAVAFIVFHRSGSQNDSSSKVVKQLVPTRSSHERLDVFVISISEKNTVVLRRDNVQKEQSASIVEMDEQQQTENPSLLKEVASTSIDKYKHLTVDKLGSVSRQEKSRSRPLTIEGEFPPPVINSLG